VVRAFTDDDVVHVTGKVDPADDIEIVHTELILADLQTLEKAVPRLEKEVKGKKTDKAVLEAAMAAQTLLEKGTTLHAGAAAPGIDVAAIRELGLMTAKPFIYVFNVDETGLADPALQESMRALVAPSDAIFLDAKLESELVELDADDAAELLASVGQTEPGMDQLARVGFHTLGLQTYLTAGPKESRAWTIRQGWTAPQAAGVIHTDFQRGFIKAEVVAFDDLVSAGSMAEAKARGKVRIEGKDYVMADGDVVEFRFNV
jgi:GTP-binding protein YchF